MRVERGTVLINQAAATSFKAQAQELVQTGSVFKLGTQGAPQCTPSVAAVRGHPPKGAAFNGADRRELGVSKDAAARSQASLCCCPAGQTELPAAKASASTATAKASGGDDEWESV